MADGEDTINLVWLAPVTGTGAAAKAITVTGYRVEYSENDHIDSINEKTWELLRDTTGPSTSTSHTSLSASTTRTYRVAAINAAGVGPPSITARATTAAAGTTKGTYDSPTGFAASPGTSAGDTDVTSTRANIFLDWTAPTNTGLDPITGYRIEVSTDGTVSWDLLSTVTEKENDAVTTEYTDVNLIGGQTRHYRVAALNAKGRGAWSREASARTAAQEIPGAPSGLNASAVNDSSIKLDWTAPTPVTGSPVTHYEIEVSTNGSTWTELVLNTETAESPSTDAVETTYTHTGLDAETERHYRVYAWNAAGRGGRSNVDKDTTLGEGEGTETTTPTGEQLGKATGISEGSFNAGGIVQIDWTAAPNADGYVIYAVNVAQVNNPNGEVITAPVNEGTRETFNLGGLTEGQTYDVYVVATASGQDAQWPDAAVRVMADQ